jgi:hypothetical protein
MTDFIIPLDGPPVVGPTDPGPTGFPSRTGRSDFGPTMKNDRPIVRPDQEINASQVELLWWQLAGLGMVAPLATFFDDPYTVESLQPRIRWGAFAWHQEILTDVIYANLPSFLTRVANATGDITYTFAATALGRDDLPHTLTVRGAIAVPCGIQDGVEDTVPDNCRCEVTLTGNAVRVRTRQAPGIGSALVQAPVIVMVF